MNFIGNRNILIRGQHIYDLTATFLILLFFLKKKKKILLFLPRISIIIIEFLCPSILVFFFGNFLFNKIPVMSSFQNYEPPTWRVGPKMCWASLEWQAKQIKIWDVYDWTLKQKSNYKKVITCNNKIKKGKKKEVKK